MLQELQTRLFERGWDSTRAARRAEVGMAHLIYTANVSLDGYTEDRHGNFDWTAPEEEVF